MGYLDSELVLSAGQSTAAFNIGDNPSTNVYDTGSANAQEASLTGENLWIRVGCTTVFAGATATVQAVLQSSPDNATWTDVVAGAALLATGVLAGQYLLETQPPSGTLRYWRTIIRVAVANLSAGVIDSYISNTIQHNISRPSGYSVA
jgi:hypothetical protein